jgi:hypothetical protein
MSLLDHPAARSLVAVPCGPAAIVGIMAVSSAVSAYGAYKQSQAQKQSAQFNSDVAKQNQRVAGVQARQAGEQGQAREDAYNAKLRTLMGTQTTQLAGTGVDVSSGSALDIRADTAGLGARDISTIRGDTVNSVWQARLAGASAADQSKLYQFQADTTSPWLAATTSALGSASSIGSSWYSMKGR